MAAHPQQFQEIYQQTMRQPGVDAWASTFQVGGFVHFSLSKPEVVQMETAWQPPPPALQMEMENAWAMAEQQEMEAAWSMAAQQEMEVAWISAAGAQEQAWQEAAASAQAEQAWQEAAATAQAEAAWQEAAAATGDAWADEMASVGC
jgi:hypothetical protein